MQLNFCTNSTCTYFVTKRKGKKHFHLKAKRPVCRHNDVSHHCYSQGRGEDRGWRFGMQHSENLHRMVLKLISARYSFDQLSLVEFYRYSNGN